MRIAVVRRSGRKHDGIVTRADGTTDRFVVYDYGDALPHDLVHYVVERERGLAFGFWGLVAAGARLAALETAGARSPRKVKVATDPLVEAHLDELLEAEDLANSAYDNPCFARYSTSSTLGGRPYPRIRPSASTGNDGVQVRPSRADGTTRHVPRPRARRVAIGSPAEQGVTVGLPRRQGDGGADPTSAPWRDENCVSCRKRLCAPVLREGDSWVHMRCYQGRPDVGEPDRPAFWGGGK
jgi:hypothetical protein